MLVLRAILFFALIGTLTSFGFAAGVLVTGLGEPSFISPGQLYAVSAVCMVSAIVSLGFLTSLALSLLGRVAVVERFPRRALVAIGLAFCVMTMYSFFVVPDEKEIDYFRRFLHDVRFDFLVIGAAALIMSVRR